MPNVHQSVPTLHPRRIPSARTFPRLNDSPQAPLSKDLASEIHQNSRTHFRFNYILYFYFSFILFTTNPEETKAPFQRSDGRVDASTKGYVRTVQGAVAHVNRLPFCCLPPRVIPGPRTLLRNLTGDVIFLFLNHPYLFTCPF